MLRGFRSQHAQRVSSFFSCTQWRYSSYTSGCITTERRSPLSERIRTPDDLNLRLSTCLYYQQPAAAINLFEQARRERLPFNDTSIEYVVYNLTEKGLYRKAEQILDDYNTQERVPPPEKAYRYILSSYAKKGDFKNLQQLFHKMNKAEVPISEKTYQHVLQHAENYLLQKDTTSSSNCKKKWQKQERNLPLSSATPHQTFTAPFETFVESVHKEDNSKKEKPASNEKGDRSSLLKEQTFKSLINDEDLAATKATKSILDDSEENENYLPSKGLYALLDGDHKSANSFLLRAIMDIFQTTESSKVAENNQLNNMIQMEGTQDLGGFSDMSEDNYNLLSLYQPGEEADGAAGQQGNGGHQQPKIQYCSLTGARLTEQNVANSEDLKIPFHDTPDDPFSVRYKYLVSDKEPISEMFSVEDKIDRGEGIMLEINDDISFSLTYDRSTVADRSVLSQLVRDGLEATPELYAAVVDGYGRGGNTNARDVAIHEMQLIGGTPNNSVINRTITTYARNLSMSELESTLDWATNHKVSLTSTTLNAILHAYTRNNEFTKAEAIVKQLEQLSSYKTNPNHEASVLYMKAIQGDSQAIEQALKERSQSDNPPTTQTYGGIISGYAKVNDHDKVCSYYKQMRQQNIPPSEEIFHDVFTSFYQKRDLHGLTECLWTARQYGFRNYLNAKRTECIIELLCEEKHFTQVIKLFGHYQQMPHLLRPRNFTFLLRGLLQNEGLSVINTLEPNMRWPCFVALAMIYGPKAREAKKSIFQLLEDDGHEITDKVVEAATYYYLQKGEFSQVMQCFAYVKVADPPIDPTAKLYAFVFLANFRDRKIKKVSKLIMNMIVNDKIGLSDLATAAKNNLSFANFNELCEEFSLYTEINLRDHVEEKSEQPNILDYLG